VPVHRAGRLPPKANFIQLLGAHPGKLQASLNCELRKAGVMLQAADAFFGHRKKQFSVANNTR
jgi:hypothetical protein